MKGILNQFLKKNKHKYSIEELEKSSSQKLYDLAKLVIPGGTQLLSKRPEMFARVWPSYYSKAKGSKIWDLDGRVFRYVNYVCRSSHLGYADPDVDEAVTRVIKDGVWFLKLFEEVFLAEALPIYIHGSIWSDIVEVVEKQLVSQ